MSQWNGSHGTGEKDAEVIWCFPPLHLQITSPVQESTTLTSQLSKAKRIFELLLEKQTWRAIFRSKNNKGLFPSFPKEVIQENWF